MNIAARICELLNQAHAADPDCIDQLITYHAVGHAEKLREHPSIQVTAWQNKPDASKFTLSCLGLLNGLCTEGKLVAAVFSESGILTGFKVVQSNEVGL